MARINIEDEIYQDFRFMNLVMRTGSIDLAIGALVRAWTLAQKWYLNKETDGKIPVKDWRAQGINNLLLDVELASMQDELIYVSGSDKQFAWLIQKSAAGKVVSEKKLTALEAARQKRWNKEENSLNGTERNVNEISTELNGSEALPLSPSLSPTLPQTQSLNLNTVLPDGAGNPKKSRSGKPKATGEMPPTKETWESYRNAYVKRYSVEPIRNAKTSSQLKQFIDRVGSAEAPEIVAFYVCHNSPRYIQSAHSTGNLLFDAEKLRTEWARGKQITSTEARNLENKQQVVNAFSKHLPGGSRD